MNRTIIGTLTTVLLIAGLLAVGCTQQLTKIGTDIAAGEGLITDEQKDAIVKSEEALRKSFEELTDQEEYYIGRSVAATILSRYEVYDSDKELLRYVNQVGRSVALASTRPEIYGGYHFLVLDADEVNAFAAPGGFIMITRGMLATVPDEEALAAVLAHEVAHVALRHGLAAIKKSRLVDAFGIIGREAGGAWNQEELLKLTDIFDGAVGDVVKTLVEKGYSRSQEEEADKLAVAFAAGIGYQPGGLAGFLDRLAATEGGSGGLGMLSTHPGASDRKRTAEAAAREHDSAGTDPAPRKPRFSARTAAI